MPRAESTDRLVNTVRTRRLEAGLTQAELAARVGVTRQTILAVEAGRHAPSLELAFRLARALDAPLETVFLFRPDATP